MKKNYCLHEDNSNKVGALSFMESLHVMEHLTSETVNNNITKIAYMN